MTTLHTSTPGQHLLLVDDDRLILTTLARALTQAGYQISTAESADEAENWLAEGHQRPQLVILAETGGIIGGTRAAVRHPAPPCRYLRLCDRGFQRDGL